MSPPIWVLLSNGTTHQHWLEESGVLSIQKIQGEGLTEKLAWCSGPALKHCLLPVKFLFPPWNYLW